MLLPPPKRFATSRLALATAFALETALTRPGRRCMELTTLAAIVWRLRRFSTLALFQGALGGIMSLLVAVETLCAYRRDGGS